MKIIETFWGGGIHGRQTIEEKRWHAHFPCIAGLSIFLVCVTRISNNLFVWHYRAGYLGLNSYADWHVLIDLQYNNGHRSVLIFPVQLSWQPQLAPVQQIFRWIESREVSCRSGDIYSPSCRHTKSNTMETYLLVYWARQVASSIICQTCMDAKRNKRTQLFHLIYFVGLCSDTIVQRDGKYTKVEIIPAVLKRTFWNLKKWQ